MNRFQCFDDDDHGTRTYWNNQVIRELKKAELAIDRSSIFILDAWSDIVGIQGNYLYVRMRFHYSVRVKSGYPISIMLLEKFRASGVALGANCMHPGEPPEICCVYSQSQLADIALLVRNDSKKTFTR